ncbi:MAG TPA: DNA polymerase III subunit delta [Gemmatimonadaceae bacterium]|nr:DNA polymerase III subunit delta [Gemmatimonadaceae bacterium]
MSVAPTSAGQKALRTALQTHVFDAVYYFHGAEDYLKDEMLRLLIEAAVDPATRDFNFETLRASDLDGETFGSLLGTPPMMAERRVVVVRDVSALKKDARRVLERYLERPASDIVLVLVAVPGAKQDRVLMERTTAVEFEPLSGARVPKWITYYATHNLGCEISPEAVSLLQSAVGTELGQLKIELDKLDSFVTGGGDDRRVIDEEAVAAIVGVQRGETLGDLLDAVAQRNAARAVELLPHVLLQPKTSAVTIVMALATQTLALAWGRASRRGGASSSRIENEFYNLLKESGSSYTGRSWGDAVRAWSRSLDAWTLAELDAALAALLAADAALKESRLSSDEQLLESLILTLCVPARRASLSAA